MSVKRMCVVLLSAMTLSACMDGGGTGAEVESLKKAQVQVTFETVRSGLGGDARKASESVSSCSGAQQGPYQYVVQGRLSGAPSPAEVSARILEPMRAQGWQVRERPMPTGQHDWVMSKDGVQASVTVYEGETTFGVGGPCVDSPEPPSTS